MTKIDQKDRKPNCIPTHIILVNYYVLLDLTKQLALEAVLSPVPYFRPYLIISKLYLTWCVFVLG